MKLAILKSQPFLEKYAPKYYSLVDSPWKISLFAVFFSSIFTVATLWTIGHMADLVTGLFISSFCSLIVSYIVGRVIFHYHEKTALQQAILEEQARELRTLNRQLANRNAELKAFAHTIAHDLKTPAGHIAGFSRVMRELWQQRHPDDNSSIALLERIEHSGRKMSEITDDLLLLSSTNRENVQRERIEMRPLLEQVLLSLSSEILTFNATISTAEDWPAVIGYPPWVEVVWINYINNSLKYGGDHPHVELGAEQQGNMVCFWVKDYGQGIRRQDQPSLFQEFSRLDHKSAVGHGLGLSIVKRIIDKLDGQVGVESEPGRGSKFYFTLPAAVPGTRPLPELASLHQTGLAPAD